MRYASSSKSSNGWENGSELKGMKGKEGQEKRGRKGREGNEKRTKFKRHEGNFKRISRAKK